MRAEAEMQAEYRRYDVYSRIAERLGIDRAEAKRIVYREQMQPEHSLVVREELIALSDHLQRYRREQ